MFEMNPMANTATEQKIKLFSEHMQTKKEESTRNVKSNRE